MKSRKVIERKGSYRCHDKEEGERERVRKREEDRERDGDIKMSSKRVLNKRHLFILLLSLSLFLLFTIENPL